MNSISTEIDKLYEYLYYEKSNSYEIQYQDSFSICSNLFINKMNKFFFNLKEKLFQIDYDKNMVISPHILNSLVYDIEIYNFLYLNRKNKKLLNECDEIIGDLNLADYLNIYDFFEKLNIKS